jgi:hypothetical protein
VVFSEVCDIIVIADDVVVLIRLGCRLAIADKHVSRTSSRSKHLIQSLEIKCCNPSQLQKYCSLVFLRDKKCMACHFSNFFDGPYENCAPINVWLQIIQSSTNIAISCPNRGHCGVPISRTPLHAVSQALLADGVYRLAHEKNSKKLGLQKPS